MYSPEYLQKLVKMDYSEVVLLDIIHVKLSQHRGVVQGSGEDLVAVAGTPVLFPLESNHKQRNQISICLHISQRRKYASNTYRCADNEYQHFF